MFIQKILRNVLAIFELNIVSVVNYNTGKNDLIVDFNGVYLYTDITHACAYYQDLILLCVAPPPYFGGLLIFSLMLN